MLLFACGEWQFVPVFVGDLMCVVHINFKALGSMETCLVFFPMNSFQARHVEICRSVLYYFLDHVSKNTNCKRAVVYQKNVAVQGCFKACAHNVGGWLG